MKRFSILTGAVLAALMFVSCDKEDVTDDTTTSTDTASLVVDFDYLWAMSGESFELGTTLYHPMSGDTMSFTTFKHYVSNITLIANDNSTWAAEESYHLIDLTDDASSLITIEDVPVGSYKGIMITFGVDSARNVSGSQTGDLDPAHGMFWSWNSGYIMIKTEGTSPQSSTGSFAYHLGGFSGDVNCITTREFDFPNSEAITIAKDEQLTVQMRANPARLWHTYGSIANGPTIHMPSTNAAMMAGDFNGWINLADAF